MCVVGRSRGRVFNFGRKKILDPTDKTEISGISEFFIFIFIYLFIFNLFFNKKIFIKSISAGKNNIGPHRYTRYIGYIAKFRPIFLTLTVATGTAACGPAPRDFQAHRLGR